MLRPEFCRLRQARLLDVMRHRRLDAAVLGLPHHVYYFTGHRPFWLHESAFIMLADGSSHLVAAGEPAARDTVTHVVRFDASWMGTQRQEQADVVAATAHQITHLYAAVGVDASPVGSQLALRDAHKCTAVDPDVWRLRRRKDPDELVLMKAAVACTEAMYNRARQIIEPGVPELHVFTELHAAAVKAAGEPLSPMHLGNDFQCGSGGGPPRGGRTARAGELYVLDLGPAYRGYFADNCRVFAVDRNPTDAQLHAWQAIAGVFPVIERMAKPGVRCRDLYAAADEHLRTAYGAGMTHHLGHGVGLQPHEFPHLNPMWDDTLTEDEVFTCEPGLYGPDLAGGLRIENQYLVTKEGVENLSPFPMELA